MTDMGSKGVCKDNGRYDTQYEADACRQHEERLTGKPHRATEIGWCYEEGVVCSSWWEVWKFDECIEGAMFDDWFGYNNHLDAIDCSISLNNIEGGSAYHSEPAQRNSLLQDSYRVTRSTMPTESSALTRLTSFILRTVSNIF